jgi:putative membrane protein
VSAAFAQFFRGFCMGAADVVPGVSGGTIALVLGIYERLVTNIRQGSAAVGWLLRINGSQAWSRVRRLEWRFLIPLLAGIGTAILLLARAIDHLLDEYPVEMTAAFFGLVVASVVAVWERMKQRDGLRLVVLGVSALVTFFALGYRQSEVADPSLLVVFGCGALAICAMILPGISGSFILLILGMYDNILDAVNDRELLTLVVFAAGCVTGLAVFAPILNAGLKRYHDTVMAALVGLMLGSLRVLWPWPEGVDESGLAWPPEAIDLVVPFLVAVGGAAIALVIIRFDRELSH